MPDTRFKPKQQTGFSKAALAYTDALLDLQEARHEAHLSALMAAHPALKDHPAQSSPLPSTLTLPADHPAFSGGGWSPCEGDARPRRWMGRLGGVLLAADFTRGGTIQIEGAGFTRRRWVQALDISLGGLSLRGKRRVGLWGQWQMHMDVPPVAAEGPLPLMLSTISQSRRLLARTERASLAIAAIRFVAAP